MRPTIRDGLLLILVDAVSTLGRLTGIIGGQTEQMWSSHQRAAPSITSVRIRRRNSALSLRQGAVDLLATNKLQDRVDNTKSTLPLDLSDIINWATRLIGIAR